MAHVVRWLCIWGQWALLL